MSTRIELLSRIDHNIDTVRHLVIDEFFHDSNFFTPSDIRFITQTRIALIKAYLSELIDMEN